MAARNLNSPVSSASLAINSEQTWTRRFIFPLTYFLVYGRDWALPISIFLFPLFRLSALKVEGHPSHKEARKVGIRPQGTRASVFPSFGRGRGIELLSEGPSYLPQARITRQAGTPKARQKLLPPRPSSPPQITLRLHHTV